jgi:hypothetical protein
VILKRESKENMPSLAASSNLSVPAPENWEAEFAPKFIKVHLIGKDRCENSQPVAIHNSLSLRMEADHATLPAFS